MEQEETKQNPMRELKVSKITLNFGAGKDQQLLEKGIRLLEKISGKPPVQVKTNKRIPGWGLRPGLPVGAKITIRGKEAEDIIRKTLTAKENRLTQRNFDNNGNVAFGVPEYIEISGMKYDPDIGMLGFEISITIERPGYRVKSRRLRMGKISKNHRVTKEDSIEFMKQKFGVKIE
jgi:large subunit ribosomal protein L5